jgi:hypothetical protein
MGNYQFVVGSAFLNVGFLIDPDPIIRPEIGVNMKNSGSIGHFNFVDFERFGIPNIEYRPIDDRKPFLTTTKQTCNTKS